MRTEHPSGTVHDFEDGRLARATLPCGTTHHYDALECGGPVLRSTLLSSGDHIFYDDGRLVRVELPNGDVKFYQSE